jgi:Spy/CpxP family protein refolding chaperone
MCARRRHFGLVKLLGPFLPELPLTLEENMHRILPWLMAFSFVATAAQAQSSAQQVSATPASPASVDSVINNFRAEMQKSRADIMAKNLTLSAEQAAKFWPVFDKYQKEQNAIMGAHLKDVAKYAENYKTLDDAAAVAFINAHLDRDAKMTALRKKWLPEFQKVLPTKLAVRAIQIDRRLSLMAQMDLASQLPLVQ